MIYLILSIITGAIYLVVVMLNIIFRWTYSPAITFVLNQQSEDSDMIMEVLLGVLISFLVGLFFPVVWLTGIMYLIILKIQKNRKIP